jgi:Ca-activated chloride channel family protein
MAGSLILLTLGWLVAGKGLAQSIDQNPAQNLAAIRVDVRLVTASFTARDSRGSLVPDLTRDQIEVIDDGVPQTVAFFSRSTDVPLSLGLIVDASGSQQRFVKDHEHDLERFLKSVLTPRDRAFLLCFGNHLRLAADDTHSAGDLVDALRRFEKPKNREGMNELGPPELRFAGTAFYDALYYSSTEKLKVDERGRRALIVFSDGEDNSSAHHMLDVIEAAQSSGVVIFGIRYTEHRHGRLTARNKYGTSVMARLARETGGADFDAEKDDLKAAFRQIGEQLRSSYEIAYHPGGVADDGSFHKLVIRARGGECTVRAKTGYYSHPPSP